MVRLRALRLKTSSTNDVHTKMRHAFVARYCRISSPDDDNEQDRIHSQLARSLPKALLWERPKEEENREEKSRLVLQNVPAMIPLSARAGIDRNVHRGVTNGTPKHNNGVVKVIHKRGALVRHASWQKTSRRLQWVKLKWHNGNVFRRNSYKSFVRSKGDRRPNSRSFWDKITNTSVGASFRMPRIPTRI